MGYNGGHGREWPYEAGARRLWAGMAAPEARRTSGSSHNVRGPVCPGYCRYYRLAGPGARLREVCLRVSRGHLVYRREYGSGQGPIFPLPTVSPRFFHGRLRSRSLAEFICREVCTLQAPSLGKMRRSEFGSFARMDIQGTPMTAPRRRWSFRLGTMLLGLAILAGPLAWVGYSLNWIRARHAFLDQNGQALRLHNALVMSGIENDAPWQIRWLRKRGVSCIDLDVNLHDETACNRVRVLFPEADVRINDPPIGGASWPY